MLSRPRGGAFLFSRQPCLLSLRSKVSLCYNRAMKHEMVLRRFVMGSLAAFVLTAPAYASARSDMKAGYGALRRHDYDKAIALFTGALETNDLAQPNLALAYHYRGVGYLETE